MTRRNVVVTGLGAFNPLGTNVEETWNAALAGTPTAAPFEKDWEAQYGLTVNFGCRVPGDVLDHMPKPETRKLDPSGQYAIITAREAWKDAGSPEVDPLRLGAVIGTGIGGAQTILDQWDAVRARGARRVNPFTVPMLMANSSSAHVELEFGARAGAHTPVSACASGAEALGYALDMIERGRADVVIAGGTEAPIHPLPIAAFANMRALSTRTDDPARASRPYDVDRDGFVIGEGAASLILESEEHAKARGARIYAYVAASGMSADAHHIAAPSPDGEGASRAIREALTTADLPPEAVVHVNAHATSTPAGDTAETHAIVRALEGRADQVIISGTKSMTGHLLGGAGALEGVLTVLALHDRVAPPTINVENLDPDVALDVAVGKKRPLPAEGDIAALNNAFGFGGHNVAIVFSTAATH